VKISVRLANYVFALRLSPPFAVAALAGVIINMLLSALVADAVMQIQDDPATTMLAFAVSFVVLHAMLVWALTLFERNTDRG